jgi:hypothetical protein
MSNQPTINITIRRSSIEKLGQVMKGFKEFTKQAVEDLTKEEAALTCREAINMSAPMDGDGGGKGDKKVAERWGNWAIESDVRSFVSPNNNLLAAAVGGGTPSRKKFDKWKSGKPPKSTGIIAAIYADGNADQAYAKACNLFRNWSVRSNQIKNEQELKSIHDKLRSQYRGRIRKNGGPKLQVPYLAPEKMIKDYIIKRQERVGWMKAGWLHAIRTIGPPKINGVPKNFGVKDLPVWITRHSSSFGRSSMTKTGNGNQTIIKVANDIGNIFGKAHESDTENLVMKNRSGKMERRFRHLMKAAIDKANKGQIPT